MRGLLAQFSHCRGLIWNANPVGQTLLIGGQVFTVIGVMEDRSTSSFSSQTVLIPVTTAQTRLANAHVAGKGYRVSEIQVKASATDSATITLASDEVTADLLRAHGIRIRPRRTLTCRVRPPVWIDYRLLWA